MEKFTQAIERNYDKINQDYKREIKEEHWSWYLFPLLKEEGQTPRAGTELYYLNNPTEILDLLQEEDWLKYYREFLQVLHHIISDGKKERMNARDSLMRYLKGVDLGKLETHIEQFSDSVEALGLDDISRLYGIIKGEIEPDNFAEKRYNPPKRVKKPNPFEGRLMFGPRPPRPPLASPSQEEVKTSEVVAQPLAPPLEEKEDEKQEGTGLKRRIFKSRDLRKKIFLNF